MNLREQILHADDISREAVTIPEWGVTVEVRGMTGAERARLMQALADAGGKPDFAIIYPDVVIGCTYDPGTGEQVFQPGDRDAINAKAGAAIERIAQVALRLSGMTSDAGDTAGKD